MKKYSFLLILIALFSNSLLGQPKALDFSKYKHTFKTKPLVTPEDPTNLLNLLSFETASIKSPEVNIGLYRNTSKSKKIESNEQVSALDFQPYKHSDMPVYTPKHNPYIPIIDDSESQVYHHILKKKVYLLTTD